MQTLALSLLALLGSPQESEMAPSIPPDLELAGFTGTQAKRFQDFFGRPVLIEFFAHWCAPCARQVPELNQLQERFGARGLIVLGVTGDTPEDAGPWVARHGMAFPYAFDPDLRLQIDLGFHPLPFAILLDPTGAVTWTGKADQLDEATLERSLTGALVQPTWDWPASAADVRTALAERDYGSALRAAEAMQDSALGADIERVIARLLESRVAIAEAALEGGDLLAAQDIASALAPVTEGLEVHGEHLSLLERIERADDGLLQAQAELRELWRTVHGVSSKQQADQLLEEIRGLAEAFPDEVLRKQAALHEAALNNLRMTLN